MLGNRYVAKRRVVIALPKSTGVTLIDPAVDEANSNLDAYWESDFDPSHICFFAGERPTWFCVRPLTRRQKDAVDASIGERSSISWYLRCGIIDVDNYQMEQPDGSFICAPKPVLKKNGQMGDLVTEEWLDDVNFPTDLRVALFSVIFKLSEPSLPLSKPSEQRPGATKSETQAVAG